MEKVRVAFPTNDRVTVEEHFGHCKEFVVYEVVDGETVLTEYLTPPAHTPGALPSFLGTKNVDAILSGGMGQRAIDIFHSNNIEVVLGVKGDIKANLKSFIDGILVSKNEPCSHHGHDHDCNH
ncbi:NifB/NifX family molybdenum-iron cluster-binding protein [bacterium]|nr:NifB/NifX family molybdenum-iron cluster-binding protein [bacterium]